MRTRIAVLVAALALAAQARAFAQTAAVLPPSGVNIAPGTLEAAQDIFRGHLAQTGRFAVVVAVPGEIGRTEPDARTAADRARGVGAEVAVVLHIARLGSSAQVRIAAYSSTTGAPLFFDRMTAASPDDLDRVLQRLAKALATDRPSTETAELDTVTEREATAPLKRAATHVFGLGVSVAGPQDGSPAPGLTLFWLYDARSFLADIAIGFHAGNGDNNDFTLGVGAYYPMSQGDFTPYIGGGARWAATEYGGARGSGIQLYAALGGILGRLGTVQVRGQLEYFVDTFSSTRTTYDYSNIDALSISSTETSSVAHGFGLTLGLGF